MLKIFLVFYTVSGGIGAVSSRPLHNMEVCFDAANRQNDFALRSAKTDAEDIVGLCEEHKSRPKVTAKIARWRRQIFESRCFNEGLPDQCTEFPNGDLEILTSARDKYVRRIVIIEKADGRGRLGIYDKNGKLHIKSRKELGLNAD